MKKHSSIFPMITAFVLITLACNVLSTVPATPQGPQRGQPPQRPEQPFSQPGQPDGNPGQQSEQPGQQPGQPGQPGQQPNQPLPQPGQPGQPGQQPGQPGQQPEQPGQQPGGQGPTSSAPTQIDKTVTIAGNGGSAEITFDISNGQWTHIVLTTGNTGMQPYGSMQYPDGMTVDCPPITTTANGTNQADILLTDPGRYTLTLFDGSNQGGPVSVKIIAMP